MNDIFGDLDYVIVFWDDIINRNKDEDSFDDYLNLIKTAFSGVLKSKWKSMSLDRIL